jgi:hypothetical protein
MALPPIVPRGSCDPQQVLHFARSPFPSPLVTVSCAFVFDLLRAAAAFRRSVCGSAHVGRCRHG